MLLIGALALGLVESTNRNRNIVNSRNINTTTNNTTTTTTTTTNDNTAQPLIDTHLRATNSIASIPAVNDINNDEDGDGVGTVIQAAIAKVVSTPLLKPTAMTAVAGSVVDSNGSGGSGTSTNDATSTWDSNGTVRSANPGDWSVEQCMIWQRPHHLYFQLGNAFLLLAFLAPHGPCGSLWLRTMLIVASILLGMYGYMIDCAQDFVLWSGLFFGVNLIYFIILLFRLRPVRFDKEIEAVYTTLFKPLRVTRHQFRKVLNCMKLICALKYQEVYAQEKVTKVDSLSLVLSGKLVVSQNQRALHIVFPHQFLDSPEWFGVSTDDYFQVSILAMEESRVLIWHRDKLKLSIMAEPFLQTVFDHILGRDVVKKLMQVTQVSESIASNGFLPSGGYDDAEDKPMLVMKKSIEGHSLTALINRQLQEEHVPLLGRTYTTIQANHRMLLPPIFDGLSSTMTVNKLISHYNDNINRNDNNADDNNINQLTSPC